MVNWVLKFLSLTSIALVALRLAPLEAHEGCHHCRGEAAIIDHTAFLFDLVIAELQKDMNEGRAPDVFKTVPFQFEDPGFLLIFKTKLAVDPNFHGSLQRALLKYHEARESHQIPSYGLPQSVGRGFFRERTQQLKMILGSGASQVARFGLLFGIGWATFELVEHSLTPFLPPGLGFLCATFPVLWAITLGPLVKPVGFLRANPEGQTLLRRAINFTKLPLREFKFRRSLAGVRMANDTFLRRSDQRHRDPTLGIFSGSPHWMQIYLDRQRDVYSQASMLERAVVSWPGLRQSLDANQLTESEAFQIEEMMLLPIRILQGELSELYRAGALSFLPYMKLKYRVGKLERAADRVFRVVFQIANSKSQEQGPTHALALESVLKDYFSLLDGFRLKQGESHQLQIGEVVLHSVAPKDGSHFGRRYGSLIQKIRTFERGRHACKAALVRVEESH